MSPHFSNKLKIAAAWAAIALGGSATGWWAYRSHESARLEQLIELARTSAVSFEAADLPRLRGTRDDVGTPGYVALKARLRRLKAINSRVRRVYIFRVRPDTGKATYLGDSTDPGAKDESLPGDNHPPAADSAGLQEIIRTSQPATEGPLTDDFGVWMTGYAAIGTWTTADAAAEHHVLGVDLDAAGWRSELWRAGFEGGLFIWILLGIPLSAWLITRRQREQNDVIRNLSEAMEQSHSAIMIIDREYRIEYANRGLCRQLGHTRRELIGRGWRGFQAGDGADPVVSEIAASMGAGRAWEGEWSTRRKDGTTLPVRGGFTPVKHRDGTIACFVAVFDDVTETKRREAELQEATAHAQAGDRAKGQFLATMSHEVRTPLNGIVGFTNLLLDTTLSAEQREYVQTIRVSTEALIQLTGDILDFARIESGKVKLESAPCDPRDCIEDTLDLLATKATEKGLELLHHAAPEVPGAIVVDGGRLRQVLVNLVGNAIKFTEHGEVEVTVALAPVDPHPARAAGPGAGGTPHVSLIFAVRDSGIGIPAEHHQKLFRAFTQLDDSTTRRYGGTGLGLAISCNLVGLMGGKISVSSQLGAGSTFTFTLRVPVAGPAPPPPDLNGARVGLAIPPGSLQRELGGLVREWRGEVVEADTVEDLPAGAWELAVVDLSGDLTREFVARAEPLPGWAPEKAVGLVPISISNDLRTALRRHFRLLVNKPVHHAALFTLLSGTRKHPPLPPARPKHPGLRVLVAEDNLVNQRLIKRVLENLGSTPTLVENGRQALDVLTARAAEFDLVLLDMHMPEMDGIEALRAIRAGQAGPQARDLWIIALTADVREQQRAQAMEAGLNGYLTKPLNLGELDAALRQFRDEQRRRQV